MEKYSRKRDQFGSASRRKTSPQRGISAKTNFFSNPKRYAPEDTDDERGGYSSYASRHRKGAFAPPYGGRNEKKIYEDAVLRVIGVNPIEIALSQMPHCHLYLERDWRSTHKEGWLELCHHRGHKVTFFHKQEISKICPDPQVWNEKAFVVLLDGFPYANLEDIYTEQNIVILDHIEDPHNMGAILRNAHEFGFRSAIIPKDRSCHINSTVMKTSVGAAMTLKLVQVVNLTQALEKLQKQGFWIYTTHHEEGVALHQVNWAEKKVLILGNEGKGVQRQLKKKSDFIVHIPTVETRFSLNVSAASAILFYEIYRATSSPSEGMNS